MPQNEPIFYDSFTLTFSVPEFSTTAMKVTPEKLDRTIRNAKKYPLIYLSQSQRRGKTILIGANANNFRPYSICR